MCIIRISKGDRGGGGGVDIQSIVSFPAADDDAVTGFTESLFKQNDTLQGGNYLHCGDSGEVLE